MPPKRRPGRRPADQPPDLCYYRPKHLACVYVNGKRKYLGPWDSPEARKAYRDLVTAWEAQHRRVVYRPLGGVRTVGDLVAAFLAHARTYYRRADGTQTDEVRSFRSALAPLLAKHEGKPIEDMNFETIRSIVDGWVEADREREYINQQLGRIKRVFKWAVTERLLPREIALDIADVPRLPKGRSAAREREPVGKAALVAVLKVMRHLPPAYRLAILFQLRSGARPGEVCAAHAREFHCGSVTVDGVTLTVPSGVLAFAPRQTKNRWRGKTTVYAIGPKLQRRLAPLIATDDYLFPGQRIDHWREDYYSTIIKAACERAAIDDALFFTPNMLRHAYLTDRQRKAGWERARQSVMHSSISTTAIYVERDLLSSAEDAMKWG